MPEKDLISSLITDGAKFLRIADDVHYLMDQMHSISSCLYALTAGVYIAIMVYVVVVCYRERRSPDVDAYTGGSGYTHNGDLELGPITTTVGATTPPYTTDTTTMTGGRRIAPGATKSIYRRHYSSGQTLNELGGTGVGGASGKQPISSRGSTQSAMAAAATPTPSGAPSVIGVSRRITRYSDAVPPAPHPPHSASSDFDPSAALTIV